MGDKLKINRVYYFSSFGDDSLGHGRLMFIKDRRLYFKPLSSGNIAFNVDINGYISFSETTSPFYLKD